MLIHDMKDIHRFKAVIENAHGAIWAESQGKVFDLKNEENQYRVIGAALEGEEYELYARDFNDQIALMNFLRGSLKTAC